MERRIIDDIFWTGVVDWNLRDFHGHETHRGTSYNAYLVRDQKTALIDTVKAPYAEQLLQAVAEIHPLEAVDFIVCNHAEPDHSGALPQVIRACPNAILVCNEKCRGVLASHFDLAEGKVQIMKDGDVLSLGRRSLAFMDTPMAHWPESMATWIPEERLLFSMDAFGQHYSSSKRMDINEPVETLLQEAQVYYANILMPFARPVAKTLARVRELDPKWIAPSHGVVWNAHRDRILDAYDRWSRGQVRAKVLVAYDTMWNSTERMARAIWEGAAVDGVEAQLLHIRTAGLTRLTTELLDTASVAIGSPCLNGTLMPQVAALLAYWKGLKPSLKDGLAFGSYGWGAKGGPSDVHQGMEDLKFTMIRDPIRSPYVPDESTLDECRDAGRRLAETARERAGR